MPSKSPEQSAAAFRTEPAEEPLRHRLHTSGEEVPRVASIVPVQFSRCTATVAAPRALGRQRTRQDRIVLERQPLIHQRPEPLPANRSHAQGFRLSMSTDTKRRQFLGGGRAPVPGRLRAGDHHHAHIFVVAQVG